MQLTSAEIIVIIVLTTFIFLLAPLFLLIYIKTSNNRKRKDLEEKHTLQLKFESELLKTHIEVQEQTMQTIAADLHDNIGQLLSLTTLTLNSIDLTQPKKTENKITTSLDLVHQSIKELRDLAKLLQGEQIIETGLGKAIKQELDRLKRIGGYKLKVKNELLDLEISSPKKDLIILRLLQEIVNNIIKHAQATKIEVNTHVITDTLYLCVKENGIGFNYKEIQREKSGMGLQSIHKRILMIHGTLQIDSSAQQGTSITITIPYP